VTGLRVDRARALAHRRAVLGLRARVPAERLLDVAVHGLQDSAPRSAVLALHARLEGVAAGDWDGEGLVQVWGPRCAVYVVRAADALVFTRGLLPRDAAGIAACAAAADRLAGVLAGRRLAKRQVTEAGADSLGLLAASATGRVLVRWDGRDTTVWAVPPPAGDPEDDRRELARRFLHACGPATAAGFAHWSGVAGAEADATFAALAGELVPVDLDGEARFLPAADEAALRAAAPDGDAGVVRLLPPGDPYLAVNDRSLLVPDAAHRRAVSPRSPWPGVVLADGELVGTWRRRQAHVTVTPWAPATRRHADAIAAEAASLPIAAGRPRLTWAD
jgi:hypothetical protein